MNGMLRSPLSIWVVLVAATLLSYGVQLETIRADPRLPGSIILIIAFFKVRLIGLRYMEIDEAVLPLRAAFEVWVFAMALVLLTLFWVAG